MKYARKQSQKSLEKIFNLEKHNAVHQDSKIGVFTPTQEKVIKQYHLDMGLCACNYKRFKWSLYLLYQVKVKGQRHTYEEQLRDVFMSLSFKHNVTI